MNLYTGINRPHDPALHFLKHDINIDNVSVCKSLVLGVILYSNKFSSSILLNGNLMSLFNVNPQQNVTNLTFLLSGEKNVNLTINFSGDGEAFIY